MPHVGYRFLCKSNQDAKLTFQEKNHLPDPDTLKRTQIPHMTPTV